MSQMTRMCEVVSKYPAGLGGASVGEVAQEWLDAGFTPETAVPWLEAGMMDAEATASLVRRGVSPEDITEESDAR